MTSWATLFSYHCEECTWSYEVGGINTFDDIRIRRIEHNLTTGHGFTAIHIWRINTFTHVKEWVRSMWPEGFTEAIREKHDGE